MSPPATDDTTSKERKPSPKKRSTMNSRDAAYTYTSLFPAASSVDEDMKMDDATSPPASRSGESRSRRRRKRVAEDDDDDPPPSSKRRRESNNTDDHIGDNHHPHQQPLTASLLPRKPKSTTSKRGRDVARDIRDAVRDAMRDVDSDINVDPQKDDSSSDHQNTPIDQPPRNKPRPPPPKRKPKLPLPGDRIDRIDSEEPPPTPTMRKEEIRPARARIPQARSGLNEMRKRVGAIMEYVGRLQADIPELPDTPSNPLIPFRYVSGVDVGADEEMEKPDMENAPSGVIMQYLTKRCLDFEVKFGKYPGRYS